MSRSIDYCEKCFDEVLDGYCPKCSRPNPPELITKESAPMFAFSRHWAMPNSDTFSVPVIGEFVQSYLKHSRVSVDPFARNKQWATHTNDINPKTSAQHHMDAEAFLEMLRKDYVRCDLAILDPPYSPRQISECYKEAGLTCGMKETQNAALYSRVKNALVRILTPDATVLSFGWNSAGMGKKHNFEILEVRLVCHGAAHNDTICVAEQRSLLEQYELGADREF